MARGKRKKRGSKRSSKERDANARARRLYARIPLWGWIIIFLAPLVLSELMFYRVGRGMSMILFPIAWIGFWVAMMHRSGWPILPGRGKD